MDITSLTRTSSPTTGEESVRQVAISSAARNFVTASGLALLATIGMTWPLRRLADEEFGQVFLWTFVERNLCRQQHHQVLLCVIYAELFRTGEIWMIWYSKAYGEGAAKSEYDYQVNRKTERGKKMAWHAMKVFWRNLQQIERAQRHFSDCIRCKAGKDIQQQWTERKLHRTVDRELRQRTFNFVISF
jgi:hypothetical protein